MKRLAAVCAVVLVVALLSGCTDLFYTTSSFRQYQSFVNGYKPGIDRQDVIDKLGLPDGYLDADGEYHNIPVTEAETYTEALLKEGAVFVYECYKYRDPADPHRLRITFNKDGKSAAVEFERIGGG